MSESREKIKPARKPDWRLLALNKSDESRGQVGAGWTNKDGSVSIRLNMCTVLRSDKQTVLTLFPSDKDCQADTKTHPE